jgi:hypothetical protein
MGGFFAICRKSLRRKELGKYFSRSARPKIPDKPSVRTEPLAPQEVRANYGERAK